MRERDSGPRIPLTVVRCQTHKRAFTLYPPGHFPYGRKAAVRVGFDGVAIQPKAEEAKVDRLFEGTIFEAARDAALGKGWDREREGSSERWWQTQRRQIAMAQVWLGLLPELAAATRELIAAALGVPLLLLREQVEQLRSAPGYRARGSAIMQILAALPAGDPVHRLARAGYVAWLWGIEARCDRQGSLRTSPLRESSARAPPTAFVCLESIHESET